MLENSSASHYNNACKKVSVCELLRTENNVPIQYLFFRFGSARQTTCIRCTSIASFIATDTLRHLAQDRRGTMHLLQSNPSQALQGAKHFNPDSDSTARVPKPRPTHVSSPHSRPSPRGLRPPCVQVCWRARQTTPRELPAFWRPARSPPAGAGPRQQAPSRVARAPQHPAGQRRARGAGPGQAHPGLLSAGARRRARGGGEGQACAGARLQASSGRPPGRGRLPPEDPGG